MVVLVFIELVDLTKAGTTKKRPRGKENIAVNVANNDSKRPKAKHVHVHVCVC